MNLQESLGIVAADDTHAVLNEAYERVKLGSQAPAILLRAWHANLRSKNYLVGAVLVVCSHLAMLLRTVGPAMAGGTVIWREFWNLPLLASVPLLFPLRRRLYFNINHNMGRRPGRVPIALRLLAGAGFRFVLFDGAQLKARYAECRALGLECPLFPVAARGGVRRRTRGECRLTIGIAGDFRSEKGGAGALRHVIGELRSDGSAQLLIGARDHAAAEPLLADVSAQGACRVVGTGSREDYHEFLRQIDIIVILAEPDAYWARHSGTIADAASFGVVAVVPSLPVFESQVSVPVPIGVTYESLRELPGALELARQRYLEFRDNFAAYLRARSEVLIGGGEPAEAE